MTPKLGLLFGHLASTEKNSVTYGDVDLYERGGQVGFRARGTVKIELTEGDDPPYIQKVILTPAKSHAVTVGEQELIVFVETPVPKPSASPISAQVWHKNTKFTTDAGFQAILIAAAAGSACIEIEIDSGTPPRVVGLSFPSTDN